MDIWQETKKVQNVSIHNAQVSNQNTSKKIFGTNLRYKCISLLIMTSLSLFLGQRVVMLQIVDWILKDFMAPIVLINQSLVLNRK